MKHIPGYFFIQVPFTLQLRKLCDCRAENKHWEMLAREERCFKNSNSQFLAFLWFSARKWFNNIAENKEVWHLVSSRKHFFPSQGDKNALMICKAFDLPVRSLLPQSEVSQVFLRRQHLVILIIIIVRDGQFRSDGSCRPCGHLHFCHLLLQSMTPVTKSARKEVKD